MKKKRRKLNNTPTPSPSEDSFSSSERSSNPAFIPLEMSSCLATPCRPHASVLTPYTRRRPAVRERQRLVAFDLLAEGFVVGDAGGKGEESKRWLTGEFIDYVLRRFARQYRSCTFLPCSFAAFDLPHAFRTKQLEALKVTDVMGKRLKRTFRKRRCIGGGGFMLVNNNYYYYYLYYFLCAHLTVLSSPNMKFNYTTGKIFQNKTFTVL